MKKKLLFGFISLSFIFLLSSCIVRNIKYERNRIIKKYSSDYIISVDSLKIGLQYIYLSSKNVESVILNKHFKTVSIKLKHPAEFISLNEIRLDSLKSGNRIWDPEKIGLIVIDGIPIENSKVDKILFDRSTIKYFKILSAEDFHGKGSAIFRADKDYLIITTE